MNTMRELFVEELAEVTGGAADHRERVKEILKDEWNTTQACCEEGQCCDYWA